ncbi:actin-domain-containing protein [Yamadazyma tenuis ATCC 10573]|uniref:Actin-domain-containing protein n=1 Tax=Candida tenuis (strain ATCC 10573 / BCRC 21748 / CBS 615 / JCM 9827 / NBRC 10315 / NRRL Y-1498 / VKM Y-70) TaxID=590646 RepID=G3BDH2_CANTC|nr:actin-domain-containing protein [Yamadazyma tenuis ATCC 10573]EGV60299.1 actin-domain-containing protein [Yamadazyma tenuis ATCC 10573]
MYTSPSIVIDNGTDTTKAGFASEDLPSLVFNSNYSKASDSSEVIIGDDEIDKYPQNEVYTLLNNGIVYDFDNIAKNWEYVYDHVDNNLRVDPKDFPLTLTEAVNNSDKNKIKTSEIVFEQFEVPIFSLVKKPLCQLYNHGTPSGLVVNLGSASTTITTILDGVIQNKFNFKSSYAGDFIDANILNYLGTQNVELNNWGINCSESYKKYQISKKILKPFKLAISLAKKNYQLPNHQYVPVVNEQIDLLEPLFTPQISSLVNVEPKLDDPSTNGLSFFILSVLKNIEMNVLANNRNNFNKAVEVLKALESNILITGNTSLLQGLTSRVINDMYNLIYKYFPEYTHKLHFLNSDLVSVWDKKFSSWLGASNLSLMLNSNSEIVNDWFVSREDYLEYGQDYILEKLK